ncbi:hypothetical protein [Burkholderia cepacia]|uniref:hypothetical protein n=1 Tax=Burkholderia cepacia TaxID=292 RepID=UPI0007590444|nr:hypothetical protein [Burkholderia cepacia]KVA45299.1 hypothetical protein WI47_23765 [Burkholderia cepacia]KVC33259.1 hypothetical protein WI70_30330 [Burkholderia cepacia]
MTERPILFSGPMVRAILEGRKTQTRRVAIPKRSFIDFIGGGPKDGPDWNDPACWGFEDPNTGFWWALRGNDECHQLPCPYGAVGDRLWVRETHEVCRIGTETFEGSRQARRYAGIAYQADEGRAEVDIDLNTFQALDAKESRGWSPSIHMPRWASRITLEITGVRAERLQSINESDARDEGVTIEDHHMRGYCAGAFRPPSIRAFHDHWDSLNASRGYGWDTNPWVWVVAFRRIAS